MNISAITTAMIRICLIKSTASEAAWELSYHYTE